MIISLFRKINPTPAVNIQPLTFLITTYVASRLLVILFISLLRKRHTTEIAIRTTSWRTLYQRRLTDSLLSLSVLKNRGQGTNPTHAVLFWRTCRFQKHFLLRFCILLTGAAFCPLVLCLIRAFGLLHKNLAELITARAETSQPWFRKFLS